MKYQRLKSKTLIALPMIATLAACGGGSDSNGSAELLRGCSPIAGGNTTVQTSVSATCLNCSVSSASNAIDGNGTTFATMSMPSNSGGSTTIRAVAQPGVVFAAGTVAGSVDSIEYGQSTGLTISLTTFANDIQQETFNFNFAGSGVRERSSTNTSRTGFTTTLQYDAVEVNFTRTGGNGSVQARVHALCSN